jgi:hypothetical protein
MGFTIKEKVFLLDYFRKRVKQENEDWPYFVPPYTEEFQARCPNLTTKNITFHQRKMALKFHTLIVGV